MKQLYKVLMAGLICLAFLLSTQLLQAQGCWKQAASGAKSFHTVVIAQNGSLWAWGHNSYGDLGDGSTINKTRPVQIGTSTDWQMVAVGNNYTLAIKNDGTLWAWGENDRGQLGNGTTTNTATPTQIGTGNNWKTISAGYSHTMATKTDGTLWGWGANVKAEIGDGTYTQRTSPVQVGTANNWAMVSTGTAITFAIKTDGSLWGWGNNFYGELGDGTTFTTQIRPKQIGTATNWKTVSTGTYHTAAIKTDGTLWGWGRNNNGQVGDGSTTDRTIPVQLGSSTNWKSITAGDSHTNAMQIDGSLWGWGDNSYGVLGLGDFSGFNKTIPTKIGTANYWVQISSGSYQTIAIKTDGTLWMCGNNEFGQLGDGTLTSKNLLLSVSCPSVLPVTYTAFTATKQSNSVLLNWQTVNEVNSAYFTVQHSINGTSWVNIGVVNAGNGNYSFVHTTPASGTNYYRLQQVDKDGKSSVSEIRSVNFTSANGKLSIYPNPTIGSNMLIDIAKDISKPISYSMYNALGTLVQQGAISQRQQTITISTLSNGLYLLRLSDGQTASFIKQ